MKELEVNKTTLILRVEEAKLQMSTHSFSKEQVKVFLLRYQDIKNMSCLENLRKRPRPLAAEQQEVRGDLLVRVEGHQTNHHGLEPYRMKVKMGQ